MPVGPSLKKVGDVSSGLGAKNETDEKTLPARLLANWSKDNKDDAALLWNMVKRDQVKALRGESLKKDKSQLPLYKHCSTWGVIQMCDQKECVQQWLDKATYRQITRAKPHAVTQLFVYGTARNPDRPLPKGMSHGDLHEDIHIRYRALGQRLNHLAVLEDSVDWDQCATWALTDVDESGRRAVWHRFHDVKDTLVYLLIVVVLWSLPFVMISV